MTSVLSVVIRDTITPRRPGDLVNFTYRATGKKWVDRRMSSWVRSDFILPRLSCSGDVTERCVVVVSHS